MQTDQISYGSDLSGSDVKVVLYTVVSVATGINDNARILFREPKMIAFGDDLTAADFTAWILSLRSTQVEVYRRACEVCNPDHDLFIRASPIGCPPADARPCPDEPTKPEPPPVEKCHDRQLSILCDPKWHRVAFQVIGRFTVADINWEEMQALATAQIAKQVGQIEHEMGHLRQRIPGDGQTAGKSSKEKSK